MPGFEVLAFVTLIALVVGFGLWRGRHGDKNAHQSCVVNGHAGDASGGFWSGWSGGDCGGGDGGGCGG